jgi:hypothetical protein
VRLSLSLWPCSVPRVTREKDSWAGLVLTSKPKSFDLQQTMKRKFIPALVVVLAAFAVFVYVYPDDLWDDAASTPSEMLKESSESPPLTGTDTPFTPRCSPPQVKAHIPQVLRGRCLLPFVSLSTCVLLC